MCEHHTYDTKLIIIYFVGTEEEEQTIKPKGLKVKEKEIHGSARPIGGFEKATRPKKKTKKDPMISGSAKEANTQRKKKCKNDPKDCGPIVEVDNVTYGQPHYTDLVRDFSYI